MTNGSLVIGCGLVLAAFPLVVGGLVVLTIQGFREDRVRLSSQDEELGHDGKVTCGASPSCLNSSS